MFDCLFKRLAHDVIKHTYVSLSIVRLFIIGFPYQDYDLYKV